MKLEIINISKKFGKKTAVDNLSLRVENGIYGLLGANGAGKSTLIKMLCGVIKPSTGRILCNGKNITKENEYYLNQLGYLPQCFGYYPDFNATEFLLYMAYVKGLTSKEAKCRTTDLLQEVGLFNVRDKKIKTFSGGMKQRLGIAQAMINNPKILVLDEPSAGLDPKERVNFRNILCSFSNDRIILLSTHIVSDIESISDKILLMRDGKLLYEDTANKIAASLQGKVWECRVPSKKTAQVIKTFNVASLKNVNDDTILRIVSDNKPFQNAIKVSPVLEDVYLYYFNTRGEENESFN